MKLKIILLTLLPTMLWGGLTTQYNSQYINSTVTYENDVYRYEYVADATLNKRDISNITISLSECQDIYDAYGDDPFKIVYEDDLVKFDSIKPKGDTFVFGFFSRFGPQLTHSTIKAANTTYTDSVYAPSCEVPEPTILSLLAGFTILLKRRCRR